MIQRFYDDVEEFAARANQEDFDFVLMDGDISDFGINDEFSWIYDIMKHLKKPYVSVIGNHDLSGNGEKVFEQRYGPLNDTFITKNFKFILLNTNSREYDFNGRVPDIGWLQQQLNTNDFERAIVVSHVPPYSSSREANDFDPDLEQAYATTLSQSGKVNLSLHGPYPPLREHHSLRRRCSLPDLHQHGQTHVPAPHPHSRSIRHSRNLFLISIRHAQAQQSYIPFLALTLLLTLSFTINAQPLPDTLALTKRERWYIPDFGTYNMPAASVLYQPARVTISFTGKPKPSSCSAMYPRSLPAARSIQTATLKLTGHVVKTTLNANTTLHALNIGTFVSYTFGKEFSSDLPGWYPSGYYWWSEAIRVNLFIGGDVSYTPPRLKGIRRFDLYYELGTNELKFVSYAQNTGYLSIWKILHAGIGVRVHFHK